MKRGADILLVDTQGCSAYDIALRRKNKEIADLIHTRAGQMMRQYAAEGKVEGCKLVSTRIADVNVNAQCADGLAPLHYAMKGNHESTVRFLIEIGADPNVLTLQGKTPQDFAMDQENLPLLLLYSSALAERGIHIEVLAPARRAPSLFHADRRKKKKENYKRLTSSLKLSVSGNKSNFASLRTPRNRPNQDLGMQLCGVLSQEEISLVSTDNRLYGIARHFVERKPTEESLSFCNLAFGTFLCHQEDLLHQLSKMERTSGEDQLLMLLSSVGLNAMGEIAQKASSFEQEKSQMWKTDPLVELYCQMEAGEETLEEVFIDSTLAEEFLRLIDEDEDNSIGSVGSSDALSDSFSSPSTSPVIPLRAKNSTGLLKSLFVAGEPKGLSLQRKRSSLCIRMDVGLSSLDQC